MKHLKPQLQKAFSIYKGTSDIYTYFYEQGYKILSPNGTLSFITSNKWCRAAYGEPLRKFLLENTTINTYLDLNGIKVFESATVDTSILEFYKTKANDNHTLNYANPKDYNPKDEKPLLPQYSKIPQNTLSEESFIFSDSKLAALKAKIESIGTPLKDWDINIYRGILTGYNEAFIIDSTKREEILKACKDENERARTEELIKPILRGRDIKRYSYEWAGLWIINTHNGYKDEQNNKIPPIDINEYPTLKAYFDKVANSAKQGKGKGFYDRDDKGITPYNLRNCAYLPEFAKPKIVYSEIVREPQFYLDNGEFKFGYFYAEATSFILSGNESFKSSLEYLLGLLHSKLCTFAFKEFYAGGGLGESGYRYKKAFLEKLPIPKIAKKQEKEFVELVKEIVQTKQIGGATLVAHNEQTKILESKLDSMVYKLYGLDNEEIAIIGGGAT
nr:TaqI-like C-terminal specificity domain-containing protein [Helicobacter sp. UBA3407]